MLDGQVVVTRSGGNIPNFYRKTERLVLNLSVGGGFFGNPPAFSIVLAVCR